MNYLKKDYNDGPDVKQSKEDKKKSNIRTKNKTRGNNGRISNKRIVYSIIIFVL
ncbi:MAG: hypothetical protein GWP09_01565, partial [Nitrospiraceae bacterium]|nr:hypothetical protein [Nitrospiraceae bacterium]